MAEAPALLARPKLGRLGTGVLFLVVGLTGVVSDIFDASFPSAAAVAALVGAIVFLAALVTPAVAGRRHHGDQPT